MHLESLGLGGIFWLGGVRFWVYISELGAVFKFISVHLTLNLLGLIEGKISGNCKTKH